MTKINLIIALLILVFLMILNCRYQKNENFHSIKSLDNSNIIQHGTQGKNGPPGPSGPVGDGFAKDLLDSGIYPEATSEADVLKAFRANVVSRAVSEISEASESETE